MFRVSGFGFKVQGLDRVHGFEIMVQGSEIRVQGLELDLRV